MRDQSRDKTTGTTGTSGTANKTGNLGNVNPNQKQGNFNPQQTRNPAGVGTTTHKGPTQIGGKGGKLDETRNK